LDSEILKFFIGLVCIVLIALVRIKFFLKIRKIEEEKENKA